MGWMGGIRNVKGCPIAQVRFHVRVREAVKRSEVFITF
jgi:hypothetical protein